MLDAPAVSSEVRDDLLRRASGLVPVLRERAAATETLRRIPDETLAELRASGLQRIGVPRGFGGPEIDYPLMLEVGCELGRGCGASAWCYSLWSAHAWLAGHWPAAAQAEVFGGGPDVLCSSSFSPGQATAEPVAGGFRLTGHWQFSSGCDAAAWLMLGATSPDGPIWVLIPRGDIEIIDTWYVSGLCGTGSKDIRITNAFVPGHRALLRPFVAGESDDEGWRLHGQLQYRVPLRALLGWDLVTPIIGMAQGAIDEFIRRYSGTFGPGKSAESAALQLRLAEASAEVDAARSVMRQDLHQMFAQAACAERFSPLEIARYGRDRAFAIRLCVQATNRLFELSGGHALFSSDPMQRIHRDVIAASHRDGFIFDIAAQPYGRLALGADPAGTAAQR